MYLYTIKYEKLKYMSFSIDEYQIGESFKSWQEEGEVLRDVNGEEVKTFPKDIYGTIVDKKLVHDGDTIGNIRIVNIYENEVIFEKCRTQKVKIDEVILCDN